MNCFQNKRIAFGCKYRAEVAMLVSMGFLTACGGGGGGGSNSNSGTGTQSGPAVSAPGDTNGSVQVLTPEPPTQAPDDTSLSSPQKMALVRLTYGSSIGAIAEDIPPFDVEGENKERLVANAQQACPLGGSLTVTVNGVTVPAGDRLAEGEKTVAVMFDACKAEEGLTYSGRYTAIINGNNRLTLHQRADFRVSHDKNGQRVSDITYNDEVDMTKTVIDAQTQAISVTSVVKPGSTRRDEQSGSVLTWGAGNQQATTWIKTSAPVRTHMGHRWDDVRVNFEGQEFVVAGATVVDSALMNPPYQGVVEFKVAAGGNLAARVSYEKPTPEAPNGLMITPSGGGTKVPLMPWLGE